jgi:hypothetical protein
VLCTKPFGFVQEQELKMAVMVKPKEQSNAVVVPDGTYNAKLTGIREFQNSYGDRIGFEFTLQGGEVDGLTVMRSTSINLSAKSKLAELLRGLLGRDLIEMELTGGMDVEELIGTECKVLVLQSRGNGGQLYSNVVQVFI